MSKRIAHYAHQSPHYATVPDPLVCSEELGAGYYVTATDGPRFWAMAGPYDYHEDAIRHVESCRDISVARHPMAHFYGWGTALLKSRAPGAFQKHNLAHLLEACHA